MALREDFLWGGATAANQCEGGYNEGGRGLANVDVVPVGKDRGAVITGKMKMFDFDDEHFYPALEAIDMYHRYKEDIALFGEMGFKTYRLSIAFLNLSKTVNSEMPGSCSSSNSFVVSLTFLLLLLLLFFTRSFC